MIVLGIVVGGWVVGVFVAWAFCRAAATADEAMEDMP